MKQSDIELANAIARGVSEALKKTPLTIKTDSNTMLVGTSTDIIAQVRAIGEFCARQDNCFDCPLFMNNVQCICSPATPENWGIPSK